MMTFASLFKPNMLKHKYVQIYIKSVRNQHVDFQRKNNSQMNKDNIWKHWTKLPVTAMVNRKWKCQQLEETVIIQCIVFCKIYSRERVIIQYIVFCKILSLDQEWYLTNDLQASTVVGSALSSGAVFKM